MFNIAHSSRHEGGLSGKLAISSGHLQDMNVVFCRAVKLQETLAARYKCRHQCLQKRKQLASCDQFAQELRGNGWKGGVESMQTPLDGTEKCCQWMLEVCN